MQDANKKAHMPRQVKLRILRIAGIGWRPSNRVLLAATTYGARYGSRTVRGVSRKASGGGQHGEDHH
jgi:hypothetical protein